MKVLSLPGWARRVKGSPKVSITLEIDPDLAYPAWREKLINAKVMAPDQPLDQYWLEVIYQCTKLELQEVLAGTEFDPAIAGKAAEFHIVNRPKWALRNFPTGRGVKAATQGREARHHYVKAYGRLPPAQASGVRVAKKPWWKIW